MKTELDHNFELGDDVEWRNWAFTNIISAVIIGMGIDYSLLYIFAAIFGE